MIYFIQAETVKRIKIGYTKSKFVIDRLKTLQTGCPDKLILLCIYPGANVNEEHSLHKMFDFCRVHGEWFEPHPKLLEYINGIKEHYNQSQEKRKIFNGKAEQYHVLKERTPYNQDMTSIQVKIDKMYATKNKNPSKTEHNKDSKYVTKVKYTDEQINTFPSIRKKVENNPSLRLD